MTPASVVIDQSRALRLLFCASGICGCYITYGVLQERLYQAHGLGASFVLFTQCITNSVVSYLWLQLQSSSRSATSSTTLSYFRQLPHWLLLMTAGCYVTAMVCSNEAIYYNISYPVQVLAKSCKLIPTMIVGQLVDGRRAAAYGRVEWCAAVMICSGIVLFHHFNNNNQNSKNKEDDKDALSSSTATSSQTSIGIWLLLGSLTMDGFLSSLQNAIKRRRTAPNAAATMFFINVYALIYLVPFCIITGQWNIGIHQLKDQQQHLTSLLILNATVAAGQIFIFISISWFSPVTTTIITTTRKFLTILISVKLYGHSFNSAQWVAVVTVFAGIYLAILNTVQRPEKTTEKRD
jgi:solute carrier family 35 (UDP-galactose transporter), member B1